MNEDIRPRCQNLKIFKDQSRLNIKKFSFSLSYDESNNKWTVNKSSFKTRAKI